VKIDERANQVWASDITYIRLVCAKGLSTWWRSWQASAAAASAGTGGSVRVSLRGTPIVASKDCDADLSTPIEKCEKLFAAIEAGNEDGAGHFTNVRQTQMGG
jgi:hypothetical protein